MGANDVRTTKVGSYTTPTSLGLLTYPAAELTLRTFLSEEHTGHPSRSMLLREFFGCLARGLWYIHRVANTRHFDIRPERLLLHENTIKISDFGLSLDWTGSHPGTIAGTSPGWSSQYCAPEVAKSRPRNAASDMWSLGCVFLEIVTILKGKTIQEMLDFIGGYGVEESANESTPYHSKPQALTAWMDKLVAISGQDNEPVQWAREMLDISPEKRPNAEKLVDHTCFHGKAPEWPYCGNCCLDMTDDEGGLNPCPIVDSGGAFFIDNVSPPEALKIFSKLITNIPVARKQRIDCI
jgi:serine/threonine protein kinase